MSLLMQALKKAEGVKQKQDSTKENEQAEPDESLSLTLQDMPTFPAVDDKVEAIPPGSVAAASGKAELDKLAFELEQSVSAPSETMSFEAPALPSPPRDTPSVATPLKTEPRIDAVSAAPTQSTKPHNPQPAPQSYGSSDSAREKAKAVFASKRQPDNWRRLILGGGLLCVIVVAAGFGYYVWRSITPSSDTFTSVAMPENAVSNAAPVAAPATPTPAPSAPAAEKPAETAEVPVPVPPKASATPAEPPAALSRKPATTARTDSAIAHDASEDENPARPAIQIRAGSNTNGIDPSLTAAYQSLVGGNLDQAQRQYQTVLQKDANNRDSLLGMAAIMLRRKQPDQAESYYARLLELDPLDPDATAGLIGMQQGDAAQSESRLKKVLAQHPQAGALWFALGNIYAQQSRWAEAQQSYFRAFGNQSENADYAFNLAVSLDRLNQPKLALGYYMQSLKLVRNGNANFSEAAVEDRIKKLQAVSGG